MAGTSGETQIKVARISALQAILVALITTLGGLVGGLAIGRSSAGSGPARQHWLVIEGVHQTKVPFIRVVATVNGLHFSYPSRAVWAEVNPGMSKERFPLPINADSFLVSFTAFGVHDPLQPHVAEFTSQVVEETKVHQLPARNRAYGLYDLYEGVRGGHPDTLSVNYSIE